MGTFKRKGRKPTTNVMQHVKKDYSHSILGNTRGNNNKVKGNPRRGGKEWVTQRVNLKERWTIIWSCPNCCITQPCLIDEAKINYRGDSLSDKMQHSWHKRRRDSDNGWEQVRLIRSSRSWFMSVKDTYQSMRDYGYVYSLKLKLWLKIKTVKHPWDSTLIPVEVIKKNQWPYIFRLEVSSPIILCRRTFHGQKYSRTFRRCGPNATYLQQKKMR